MMNMMQTCINKIANPNHNINTGMSVDMPTIGGMNSMNSMDKGNGNFGMSTSTNMGMDKSGRVKESSWCPSDNF